MATQTYENFAQSTLAGTYTAGDTSITVAAGEGALFPSAGDFRVVLDDPPAFVLKCTSRTGDVLTVTSTGQEGTSAANKTAGTKITQVLTKAALDGIRGDLHQTGAFASALSSKAGNLYLPNDGLALYRDTGSVFSGWGPIWPLTDPTLQSFSWVNQGAATVTTTQGGIILFAPANASRNQRYRVKTAPGVPYTISAGFLITRKPYLDNSAAGLIFRESGSGKTQTFGTYCTTTGPTLHLYTDKWTNATTPSASYSDTVIIPSSGSVYWLRVRDDNVNRYCDYSLDGINWINYHSIGRTDFLTADQVGFFAEGYNNIDVYATLISWKET